MSVMSVQTSSVRAVVNPANGSYVAESTAFRKRVKTVKREEPDGKNRPPKEEPKKQIASSKRKPPSNPKYAATVMPANPSKSTKPEMNPRTGTDVVQRDNPNMRGKICPLVGKAVQCVLLEEYRIICAPIKDIPSIKIADMCTCRKEDRISPGEAEAPMEEIPTEEISETILESVEEPAEAAPVAEDTVEDTVEESMQETPTEEVPIEEVSIEESPTEEIATEETPAEEVPMEEISAEEAPMEEALPEVPVSEVPEITEPELEPEPVVEEPELEPEPVVEEPELEPEPVVEEPELEPEPVVEEEAPPPTITAIPDRTTDLDEVDPTAPIEISREFDGKRTNVSVQMQTSNTILTQILSEFQVGNKKRQILMSIKVQSNLEGCDEEEQPSNNPSSSNEVRSDANLVSCFRRD